MFFGTFHTRFFKENLWELQRQTPQLDMDKLNAFMGKAVGDMGAAMHAVLVLMGDRLGLYKAMGG